jgi:hypothetical protein
LLNCRHVRKTCAFHDALQAGNRKKSTHRNPLIWRPQAPDQRSTVDSAEKYNGRNHTGNITTHYMIYHLFDL